MPGEKPLLGEPNGDKPYEEEPAARGRIKTFNQAKTPSHNNISATANTNAIASARGPSLRPSSTDLMVAQRVRIMQ